MLRPMVGGERLNIVENLDFTYKIKKQICYVKGLKMSTAKIIYTI